MAVTVTISRQYRIVIPQAAREALSLSTGDELMGLCISDRIVIIPKPKQFAKRTRALHREVCSHFATAGLIYRDKESFPERGG